ncbi:MAG: ABC transporter substrate-binding protein [Propionibacteriales bacterium]|nr:ABC transporter substrate-binding protein [Propionibacteriales bacterium]
MRKQALLRTALALTGVLVLIGCSGGGKPSSASSSGSSDSPSVAIVQGGDATVLLPAAPLDLDPSTSQDNNASMPMWKAWFQNLVQATENGLEPQLASEWKTSKDELTYTFMLDSAATFSDGEPVTAADVVFSLRHNLSPDVSLLHFLESKIASMEAVDTSTVSIVLKTPWPHLLADLSSPTAAIYSQAAFEDTDPKSFFNTAPVGTGPFTLGEVVANTSYTVRRNDSYWQPETAAHLDSIEFQIVTDETARVSAVLGGRADIAQSPPGNQIAGLQSNSSVDVATFPSSRVDLIVLNTTKPPFDDVKLRQAFSLALDREAMVKAGLFGYGDVATTLIVPPPALTFQNTKLDLYPRDVDKAKQLVAESGVSTPIPVELTVSTGSAQEAILTIAQQNLGDVGFTVKSVRKDPASVDNDIIGQTYTAATTFWGDVMADPSIQPQFALDPGYCCDAYFSGYDDPQLVALVQKAINATDTTEAQSLFDELQRKAAEAAFLVPLYYPQLTYLLSKDIGGFSADPFGFYDWAAVGRTS